MGDVFGCVGPVLQEAHLIHRFKEDFYGKPLNVLILGYIRPERSFNSLGES